LAQEKMAETLGCGFPPVGTQSGVAENDGQRFTWRTEVTDASGSQRQLGVRLDRVRKLSVEVARGDDLNNQQVRLTTYVAEKKIRAL
ncbi:MAG: type II secretion system protein, partial [Solirubrobacterales bacterium]